MTEESVDELLDIFKKDFEFKNEITKIDEYDFNNKELELINDSIR